ncbi:MAG: family 16 glycosylhydrolase [Candidatus Azobacteroides sp.]|nr:family 16 glycosylhydrolase [Candidatus Azobacteroides sp.]
MLKFFKTGLYLIAVLLTGNISAQTYQCDGNNVLSGVGFELGTPFYAYGDGWTTSTDYTCAWEDNNKLTIHLGTATQMDWQAQFSLMTGLHNTLTAGKTYFLSFDIETSTDLPRVYMKVQRKSLSSDDPEGYNNRYLEIPSLSLSAGKHTVSGIFSNINETTITEYDMVLFDFGGNPANTDITISNITICDGYSEKSDDYYLVWEDEFNDGKLDKSVWNTEVDGDGGGNNELQYYRDENVSVGVEPVSRENCLILTAKKEDFEGHTCTSGRLNTVGNMEFKYGKLEGRIKLPKTANGLWPAFWMLGGDISEVGWPQCGEVDIMEMGSYTGISYGAQEEYFGGTFHWGESWPQMSWGQEYTWGYSLQDDFHLFTLVWDENSFKMYLDQDKYPDTAPYVEMNISKINGTDEWQVAHYFHKPFYVVLNLAVGGNFPQISDINDITALNASNNYEAKMYIDYLKLYQKGAAGEEFYYNPVLTKVDNTTYSPFRVFCVAGVLSVTGDVEPAKMVLYNLAGQKVQEVKHTHSVNVSNLSSGIYILKIQTELGTEEVHKVIINN